MQYTVDHGSIGVKLRVLLDVLGLTHSSSGLVINTICDNEASTTSYTALSSAIETITTLGTYAAPSSGKCRFKAVDATNHPYLYEVQLLDARFAVSGATSMVLTFTGAGIRSEGIHVPIDLPTAPLTTTQIAEAVISQLFVDTAQTTGDAETGSAMRLIAELTEAALLNDADGQAFKAALSTLVQQLFDAEADIPVTTLRDLIVAGVWSAATRTLSAGGVSAIADAAGDEVLFNTDISGLVPAGSLAECIAAIKTLTTAVKAKTDQLTFTVANRIDATALGQLNLTHVNGLPIVLSDLKLPLVSGSPTAGGVLKLVPGNRYSLATDNAIIFPTGTWIDLAKVQSVALSVVYRPDRPDRTVVLNGFAGVVDAANSRVYFEPAAAQTTPLNQFRTRSAEEACYDVDFTMRPEFGGGVQTRVHGSAEILDPIVNP